MSEEKRLKDVQKFLKAEKEKEALAYSKATGHRKPVTRREFLASGLIPAAASLLAPMSVPLLGSRAASAQTADSICGPDLGASMVPIFTLSLSGGSVLASHSLPMDKGGQPLPSYSVLGRGSQPNAVQAFGTAFFAENSSFLAGLLAKSEGAESNTAFFNVCSTSLSDNSTNKFDIIGMAAKAGLRGGALPTIGSESDGTGHRNKYATIAPPAPLRVRSYNDIFGALGGATRSMTKFETTQRQKLFDVIARLTGIQSERMPASLNSQTLGQLSFCGTTKNKSLVQQGPPQFDSREHADLQRIWSIDTSVDPSYRGSLFDPTNANSLAQKAQTNAILSIAAFNILNGNSGAAGVALGGYDYHNRGRVEQDSRDNFAGETVGSILASAQALGKKVFIYVVSDGACSSARSDSEDVEFTGDNSSRAMSFVFAYDPSGRPSLSGSSDSPMASQLGYYTSGQVVDRSFLVGDSPEVASMAVFANWMAFNNKTNQIADIIGEYLSQAEVDSILKIRTS